MFSPDACRTGAVLHSALPRLPFVPMCGAGHRSFNSCLPMCTLLPACMNNSCGQRPWLCCSGGGMVLLWCCFSIWKSAAYAGNWVVAFFHHNSNSHSIVLHPGPPIIASGPWVSNATDSGQGTVNTGWLLAGVFRTAAATFHRARACRGAQPRKQAATYASYTFVRSRTTM